MKKPIKKIILSLILILVTVTSFTGCRNFALTDTITTEDGFVLGFYLRPLFPGCTCGIPSEFGVIEYTGDSTELTIPKIHNGVAITSLGFEKFYGADDGLFVISDSVQKLIIPNNIKRIYNIEGNNFIYIYVTYDNPYF
ncbi:MAG: hypothetical protein FWE22_03855 [Firmicutes bacterium]|nr:hypothetical protein [Bacillota bacterium]